MEILLAMIASALVEFIKLLSKKFGLEMSKKIVFGLLFIVILIPTALIRQGLLPQELVAKYFQILIEAVGIYQLVIKPVKTLIIKK